MVLMLYHLTTDKQFSPPQPHEHVQSIATHVALSVEPIVPVVVVVAPIMEKKKQLDSVQVEPVVDRTNANPQFKSIGEMREQLLWMQKESPEFAHHHNAFMKSFLRCAPIPARDKIDEMLVALRANLEHDYWFRSNTTASAKP